MCCKFSNVNQLKRFLKKFPFFHFLLTLLDNQYTCCSFTMVLLHTIKFSGDELLSMLTTSVVDDVVYKLRLSKWITVRPGVMGLSVLYLWRWRWEWCWRRCRNRQQCCLLFQTSTNTFDKKSFLTYIKGYEVHQAKLMNPTQMLSVFRGAAAYVKKVIGSLPRTGGASLVNQ